MSEAGNGASSDSSSSNSAAADTSATSDAMDTPQIEQASNNARIVLVKDENKSTAQLLDEYAAMPGVLYVQPNYLYELASLNGSYNDPYIDKQWFLEDSKIEGNPTGIGVENAWTEGNYGGNGYPANSASQSGAPNSASEEAVVAVIDIGVRYDHPDLEDSMWIGGEEVANALGWSTDVDSSGIVDDGVACGYDTYALTAEDQATAGDVDGFGPMDKIGHGTHIAGIVGAQLNNNEGGSGVAPGVKIMALRAAGDVFPSSSVFKAFQYIQTAKELGVNVVAANNSWGGYSVDTLYTLIADDLHESGIVVLKASSYSAKDHDVTPTDGTLTESIVQVNAIDRDGQLANFSDYGASSTDVAAPGVSIFSTVMDRDGAPNLDDESVVVKDGETPLKGTFIDMFGSSESFAFEVALQDVGPTAGASAEVTVDGYGNFAWDMTLHPGDSSAITLTANKPISAEAVEQINYLAFSAYAQSDIGGGFYVSLSAKGKEKDAAGNYERVELDSVGINQGSDGAYLTALTSLTDEQKDAIDWDNFTLYMSRTNTSSSDTWEPTFNFNACAFVSKTTPYTSWDGTSMATPVVSGVAALIAQDLAAKGLTEKQKAAEVRARLIGGAIRDKDSLMGTSQSDGRLDVKKALEDPNPVIAEVNQSKENPANVAISGFFFGSSPSIEIVNADASDAQTVKLSVSGSSSNEDGSTTYNVTLPEGMKEGSYYLKATNAENSNWGRMKLSLKAVPESSESGEEDPDNPSVDSDYFEAVASLSNDMTNLEGVPDGKKVGRTGYLTTPINVQSIGSKIYVMTRDFYLVDSEIPEYEDDRATYLLFVYDTETQLWSADQNLASEDYVPCVSMAASGEHLYLISSDGVQDYNTKDGSLSWIIGDKGTNTLALKYGFNSGQNEFLYSATSYVNGDKLWITCVNKETLDGDVESYEFLNSVLVFDLSNPLADAKVMSSVKVLTW